MNSLVRMLAVTVAAFATLLGAAGPALAIGDARTSTADAPAPGVLVGVAGLQWSDVDASRTPNLWRLVGNGSVASVSVRTLTPTCPVDAWLTLSAGGRVVADMDDRDVSAPSQGTDDSPSAEPTLGCPDVPAPHATSGIESAMVPGWSDLVAPDPLAPPTAEPGALGALADDARTCATAVGPGAAVALAQPDGLVPRYLSDPTRLTSDEIAECPATVVDLGALPDAAAERTEALEVLDAQIGALATLLPGGARLVVAGISDTPLGPSDLQVVVDWTAPGSRPTWLTSTSSRWPGVVVLADLSATVADALVDAGDLDEGSQATSPFTGSALERGEVRRLSVARTVENRRYLGVLTETVPQMTPVLVGTLALADVLVVGGLLLSRRRAAARDVARAPADAGAVHRHGRRLALAVLVVASALPVAASVATLARWWVWPTPVTTLALALTSAVLAVALAAWWLARPLPASPWRLPTTIAGLTWLVLTVDGLTGTTLQQGSLLGPAPALGARFYGFSNTVFAVYAVAGLVLAAGAAAMLRGRGRPAAATTVAGAVGVVTVVVDGLPPFGADLGGILALVPGFAVLVLGVAGARVTWGRLLGVGAATVTLVLVVAVVDWATGPKTHLGGFVRSVLDGYAYGVVAGKAAGAWATVANPGGALVLLGCVALAWALLDPERWRLDGVAAAYSAHPLLRRLVLALLTTAAVGTVLNDSGVAIAMFVVLVATPILLVGPLEHAERPRRRAIEAVRQDPAEGTGPARSPGVVATPGVLVGVSAAVLVALLLGATALPARGLASAGDVTAPGTPVIGEAAPVVLIGTEGLRWDDVTPVQTPALWELLRDGASAAGVTPAVTGPSGDCAAAGWLGLSSGRSPVAAEPVDGTWTCQPWAVEPRGEGAVVDGWDGLVTLQSGSAFRPRLGVLGAALTDGGVCTTAVGPGAALALAQPDGSVDRYRDLDTALDDPRDTFGCPLTVVDAGAAPYHRTGTGSTTRPVAADTTDGGDERASAVRAVDTTVRRVLSVAPDDATVIVLDVGNPAPARPALGVGVADADADDAPAYLTSAATRWLGVVRLLDVPTTLVEAYGLPRPVDVSGAPLTLAQERPSDTADAVAELAGITNRDHSLRVTTGAVTTLPTYLSLLAFGLVVLLLPRWRRAGSVRSATGLSRVLDGVLLVCASVPAATFLMSAWAWWRVENPTLGLWSSLLASTAVVALVGALAPRRPAWAGPTVVATLTFAVLTLDAVLGTPLHRGSPLGSAPTLGGRYYGFGNPTYSVYAVAAVFCAAGLATLVARRWNRVAGAVVAGVVGLVTLVVTVWPTFGVDVGGGLVLLPVFVVLVLGVLGARLTWRRLAVAGGTGVLLVALIGVLDWLRPPDERSHLGAFVQSVLDGTALETVLRKGGYALRSLSGGLPAWLTLAVLVGIVLALWAPPEVRRRMPAAWLVRVERASPLVRPMLVALLVAGVGGALVNDYGVRVVTIMLFAAVPLVGLLVLRTDDALDVVTQHQVDPSEREEARAG